MKITAAMLACGSIHRLRFVMSIIMYVFSAAAGRFSAAGGMSQASRNWLDGGPEKIGPPRLDQQPQDGPEWVTASQSLHDRAPNDPSMSEERERLLGKGAPPLILILAKSAVRRTERAGFAGAIEKHPALPLVHRHSSPGSPERRQFWRSDACLLAVH